MKRLFFVAALAVATISANAQNENKPLTFSVGAEAHLPVGDWSDVYSVAFGQMFIQLLSEEVYRLNITLMSNWP